MSKLCHVKNSKTIMANSVGPDEVAHDEPPHLDLSCLQIPQFYILAPDVSLGYPSKRNLTSLLPVQSFNQRNALQGCIGC